MNRILNSNRPGSELNTNKSTGQIIFQNKKKPTIGHINMINLFSFS